MKVTLTKNKPTVLASIVMEIEALAENDRLQMLDAIRKRKLVLAARKLDQKVKKNLMGLNEIVAEVKKVRKSRSSHGAN